MEANRSQWIVGGTHHGKEGLEEDELLQYTRWQNQFIPQPHVAVSNELSSAY